MATVTNARTVAGSLVVTALTLEWIDRLTITGIDTAFLPTDKTKIDKNFLGEAYNLQTAIPAQGDMHPIYTDTCCSNVEVRPAQGNQDSPDSVQVDVRWLRIRKDKDGFAKHTVAVDQYQSNEIRNFDKNGQTTKVKYTFDSKDEDRRKFPPERIADIRVPRTMFAVRISQYEIVTGKWIANLCQFRQDDIDVFKLPMYNSEEWMGFPSCTLLYLGSRIDYQGIPIARRDYSFLTNDRGFNKFIAVYQQKDGYVPPEIKDLPKEALDPKTFAVDIVANGIGCFDMLDDSDFEETLPNIHNVQL
jgi:hypothetical protein